MLKIDDLTNGQRPLNESDAWSETPTYDPSHRNVMVDDPATGRRPAITPSDLWDYPGAEQRMVDDAVSGRHPIGDAPEHRLRVLIESLGGSLWIPNVNNFVVSDGTTAAEADSIVGYVDDVAGTNNATQATTGNKPLLKQTDGKLHLLFDNSNDYLQTPINPTISGYFCCAARLDSDLSATDCLFGALKTTTTIQAGASLAVLTSGVLRLTRATSDGSSSTVDTTTTITRGVPFVSDCGWGVSRGEVRLNGAGEATSTATKDAANTSTAFTIGALNQGTSAAPSIAAPFGGAIFLAGYIPGRTTGPELVTNGRFDTDTGWSLGANTAISGGVLSITGASTSSTSNITFTVGKSYTITYEIKSVTNAGTGVRVRLGGNATGSFRTAVGTYTETLAPANAGTNVVVDVSGTGFTGTIDNISVKEYILPVTTEQQATIRKLMAQIAGVPGVV